MLGGLAAEIRGLLAGDFLDFQGRLAKTTGWPAASSGGAKVRHWAQTLASMRIRVLEAG